MIPNVQITLTKENTGVAQRGKTNGTWLYTLSGVQPGKYTLRAETAGFEHFEEKAITVQTTQNLTLDIKLRIGNASQGRHEEVYLDKLLSALTTLHVKIRHLADDGAGADDCDLHHDVANLSGLLRGSEAI